jgi:hypothetical protein
VRAQKAEALLMPTKNLPTQNYQLLVNLKTTEKIIKYSQNPRALTWLNLYGFEAVRHKPKNSLKTPKMLFFACF